jgi:hypothetical protein
MEDRVEQAAPVVADGGDAETGELDGARDAGWPRADDRDGVG